jgi:putative spermidine/putrescine transport system substrate-binding protein
LKRFLSKFTPFSLIALLIMLTFAACGSTTTSTSGSATTTLNLYVSGDVNVQSLYNNTLIPQFEKAYPSIKIHLVYSADGTNDATTLSRVTAAVDAKKNPGYDLIDAGMVVQAAQANLMEPLTTKEVPTLSHIDPTLLKSVNSEALPYRASAVVLAYNSTYVKQPPKTLSALLAWIKANPGKFTYNTPSSGGSGGGFVQTVLNSHVPASAENTFITGYNPSLESDWNQGLQDLKSINSSVYRNGYYPTGNTAVLQLLANGSIDMAPVWSDQSLTDLSQNILPSSIKLTQISPALEGGPAYLGVPRYAAHPQQAYTFLNWVLGSNVQAEIVNQMKGFPGVEWSYMPSSLQAQFSTIAQNYGAAYSSKYTADLDKDWQDQVAGS